MFGSLMLQAPSFGRSRSPWKAVKSCELLKDKGWVQAFEDPSWPSTALSTCRSANACQQKAGSLVTPSPEQVQPGKLIGFPEGLGQVVETSVNSRHFL